MRERVGVIGLGRIGGGVARHILAAGWELHVHDVVPEAVDVLVRRGARSATPERIAEACDIVLTSLPTPEALGQVLVGPSRVLLRARPGSVIVDLSTISPALARELGSAAQRRSIEFLDAPLSGGMRGASEGSFAVMIGGPAAAVARASPVLETFCARIIHVGPHGHGAATKLLHNMVGEIQVHAFAEAFCCAAKLGLDINQVYDALVHGMASSRILTELYGESGLRDIQPRATIDMALKDQTLLAELAQEAQLPLGLARPVFSGVRELLAMGLGAADVTATLRLYEARYETSVPPLRISHPE